MNAKEIAILIKQRVDYLDTEVIPRAIFASDEHKEAIAESAFLFRLHLFLTDYINGNNRQ